RGVAEAGCGVWAEALAPRLGGASQAVRASGPVYVGEASELSDLFYAAKAPERRLILINLDYAALIPSQPLPATQRTDVWRLESAALDHSASTPLAQFQRIHA